MSTGELGYVEVEKLAGPSGGVCWNMTEGPHGAVYRVHYPYVTRDYCRDDIPAEYRELAESLDAGHRKGLRLEPELPVDAICDGYDED